MRYEIEEVPVACVQQNRLAFKVWMVREAPEGDERTNVSAEIVSMVHSYYNLIGMPCPFELSPLGGGLTVFFQQDEDSPCGWSDIASLVADVMRGDIAYPADELDEAIDGGKR